MISFKLSQIAKGIKGQLIGHDGDADFVFTDSRLDKSEIENGRGLFIALRGENFDAHRFVEEVSKNSIAGVIVERKCEISKPQILVEDTRIALGELARLNRSECHAKFVAITGSCGKTTVKEMIASILELSGHTHATKGNLNNDIGAPLTLLEIDQSVEYGVIELGANHSGEIAYTSNITQPDVALVNNVTASHLQGFGDLEGVASAKAEIYSSLAKDGVAVINADDNFCSYFKSKVQSKKILFSVKGKGDIFASNIVVNSDQSTSFDLNYHKQKESITLPLVGEHNVSNALAAASCCIALGISLTTISQGLANSPTVSGRLMVNQLPNGCRVIDDSYNANLASVKAAIDLLVNYSSPTILVLGDMAELGELSQQYHQEVGEYARQKGVSKLFTFGEFTKYSQLAYNHKKISKDEFKLSDSSLQNHFSQQQKLIIKLIKEANEGVTILVKGSRSARMENIVKALLENSKLSEEKEFSNEMVGGTASLAGEQ